MRFNRRMMAFLLALPVQPTFAQQPGATPSATVVGPICADQVSVPITGTKAETIILEVNNQEYARRAAASGDISLPIDTTKHLSPGDVVQVKVRIGDNTVTSNRIVVGNPQFV